MGIHIAEADLDVLREPLRRPFGFKGGYFTEKWVCRVSLTSSGGSRAVGLGGLAVLWSDPELFAEHTEVGGNLVMASLLETSLLAARGTSFDTPIDLLNRSAPQAHEAGKRMTGRPNLRRTFALNSLIALDNAAWILYARENGISTFDEMIPEPYRQVLGHRHRAVASIPAISYKSGDQEIVDLVDAGHFFLKVKIGAPGEPAEMLQADKERLTHLHGLVGSRETAHAGVRYYLDANGRYRDLAALQDLLDHAKEIGAFGQIALLEEPFPEEIELDVSSVGVRVVADESVQSLEDVARKAELGYGAIALKPAGKTLSLTLQVAREADRLEVPCFVADSACVPRLLDWNRNIAARLAPLPGEGMGLLEVNGPENYRNWERLVSEHPCHGADWLEPRNGLFELGESFYQGSGGILTES
ncbi:MAG: enolase C-terminal domain-like protein [Trueperaceae bacterium]